MKKIKKSGFSLMEMMIVLLIISIVAAATAPLITKKMAKSGGGAGNSAISWLNMKDYGNSGKGSLIIGAKKALIDSKVYINSNDADQPQLGFGSNGTLTGILGIQPIGRISFGGIQGNMAAATADHATAVGSHAQAGGESSIALGRNSQASGESGVAIGREASGVNTANSVALGRKAHTAGDSSVAIGDNAGAGLAAVGSVSTSRTNCIGIGTDSSAIGESATAIGQNSLAQKENSIAIGHEAEASGERSISIGSSLQTGTSAASYGKTSSKAKDSIAIGTKPQAKGISSIAIGNEALTEETGSIAIGSSTKAVHVATAVGFSAKAEAECSTAIGYGAKAEGHSATAIGAGALATKAGETVIGGDTVYIPGNLVVNGITVLGYAGDGKSAKGYNHKSYVYLRESGDAGDLVRFYRAKGGSNIFYSTSGSHSNAESVSPLNFPVYTESCDRRLKNVGEKFTAGLEQIKKLDLYNFTFKADKAKTPQVGVMAQDLQKIFPNAVWKGEDGYLRIRWDEMFYAVINAVKELDAKVTTAFEQIKANTDKVTKLQAQVDEQQKVIADLEKRLAKLEKKE